MRERGLPAGVAPSVFGDLHPMNVLSTLRWKLVLKVALLIFYAGRLAFDLVHLIAGSSVLAHLWWVLSDLALLWLMTRLVRSEFLSLIHI